MELKSQSPLKCPVPSSQSCGEGNISLLQSWETTDPQRAIAPQEGQLPKDLGSSRAQKVQEKEQEEETSLELTPGRGGRAESISLVSGKGLQPGAILPCMLLQRGGGYFHRLDPS